MLSRYCRYSALLPVAFAFLVLLSAHDAEAKVRLGTLTCEVASGGSFILGSTKDLRCVFRRIKGPSEAYVGKIEKLGLDLGPTGPSTLVWGVLAATGKAPPGMLAGTYLGVSAGAAVGVGGDANVLVGGGKKSISLQPLSVVGETGLNVTAAIAGISLKPMFTPPPAAAPAPAAETTKITATFTTVIENYGCGSYVVVHPGETLSSIGKECNVSVEALLRANPKIKNVRELQPNEKIMIPIFSGKFSHSPCGTKAVLEPGETLSNVASRCGVTLHALVVANEASRSIADIKPGVVLAIPFY